MPELHAVLFDLDGTLLDSAPDIGQALNKMLADEKRPALPLDQIKTMIGNGVMELCRQALETTGGVETDDFFPYVQKFIGYYRSLPPDPAQVFPEVRNTLDRLVKAKIKLGICTNKPEAATEKILEDLSLAAYFSFVAGGDTYEVHKPHPGHITNVLATLEVNKENAVFVGDSPNDLIASQRAEVPCLIITHGYSEDYGSLKDEIKIPDIGALIPKLKEIGYVWMVS